MLKHGKRWSEADLEMLKLLYLKGDSINIISVNLERSESAIQAKIDTIFPSVGITIDSDILNSLETDICDLMQKYNISDVKILYIYLLKIKNKLLGISPPASSLSPSSSAIIEISALPETIKNISCDDKIYDDKIYDDEAEIKTAQEDIKMAQEDIKKEDYKRDIKRAKSEDHNRVILTDCQERALDYFKLKKSMCITGPAGTGKTFVLNYIKKYCIENEYNYAITAMTGVAAALISGQTLHSWTGLGLINKEISYMINIIRFRKHLFKRWTNISVLIIDEVSMMEVALFETLNHLFQKIRGNSLFFGGVQVILCGDFAQLAPIKSSNYIFQSSLWVTYIKPHTIYLNKIMRQDDPTFIKILSEIRLGIVTEETKEILNSRVIEYVPDKVGIEPTQLFPHKATVAEINNSKLTELLRYNPKIICKAKDIIQNKETKKVTSPKADQIKLLDDRILSELTFSIHSQVMLKTNLDTSRGLVNGSRGIILKNNCDDSIPYSTSLYVLFDNGIGIDIIPYEFIIETSQDIIKRMQIPLELAWASTTHKAQGSTITKVITDMRDIFCDAQGYVTLSRVKSLEGLYLIGINYDKITCNTEVIKFYRELEGHESEDSESLILPIKEFIEEDNDERIFTECML